MGTTCLIAERTGALAGLKRHDYLPFSEEIAASIGARNVPNNAYGYVDDSNRQQFTGHERDEETGLDYMQARHYGSALGRFVSVDTVGGRGTDPQTLNLYAYVNNNPLRYTDPTGHRLQDIGVYQTDDPQEARIAEQQSLRDWQIGINQSYAAQHGYIVTYSETGRTYESIEKAEQDKNKQEKKGQEVGEDEVIKVKTNPPQLLDVKVTLIDKVKTRSGEEFVPIDGEFEITFKYALSLPDKGKPEDYGRIEAITPANGGPPRGSFASANYLQSVGDPVVKVNQQKESVVVTKTERYKVLRDPKSPTGATAQINYAIVITNPNTGQELRRSSTEQSKVFGPKILPPVPVISRRKG